MDSFLLDIIAASQGDEEHVANETLTKKIGDRISELDNILTEIHSIAAIEERGLSAVLRHPVPTCYFLSFLLIELSSENLLFYLEVENFRRILQGQDEAAKKKTAEQLYHTYIKANSPLEINIISAVREAIQQAIETLHYDEEVLHYIFDDSQKACFSLMLDTWKRFRSSSFYSNMICRLKLHPVNSLESKKASVMQVLSHFSSRPESLMIQDLDFLSLDGFISSESLIKQKTLEFLKRINNFNEQELDPTWLAAHPQKNPKFVITVREQNDSDMLTFAPGALISITDTSNPDIWQGQIYGKGKVGQFPSNLVMPVNINSIEDGLEKLGEPEPNSVKAILFNLSKSIVQSCSQIIQTAQPPVASWILDGLVGTLLSTIQLVQVSDAIVQRVYLFKDVRWLQHCSTEVLTHLKTSYSAIHKAYVDSDTRLRASNPNYLSPTSVDKIFSVITDLIRATKELVNATLPTVNSLIQSPQLFDITVISRIFSEKITIIELRKSLEQSLQFLKRSLKHSQIATSAIDDPSFIFRGSVATISASLQIIESVSGLGQNQKIPPSTYDHMSSLAQNVSAIHELCTKISSDSSNRSSVKEHAQKIERILEVVDKNASIVVEEISKVQNVNQESVPDSVSHSESETVDILTKDMVQCISQFISAINEKAKTDMIPLSEKIKDTASKLGNRVVFDLNNVGITGIKKYEEYRIDPSKESVATNSRENQISSVDEMENKMKSSIKDLAQSIMLMITSDSDSHVVNHKKGFEKAISSIKALSSLSFSIIDQSKNEMHQYNIRQWNSNLVSCTQRFHLAAQESSGLIPSEYSLAELKASCTSLLATTKELAGHITAALQDPSFSLPALQEEEEEEEISTVPISPFNVQRKPISPFSTGQTSSPPSNRVSVAPRNMASIGRTRSNVDRRLTISDQPSSPIKIEIDSYLSTIAESVHKIKLNATLAAGVWPPPNIDNELKASCHNIAKSVKGIVAVFEQISSGERDRKEREFAQQLSIWKSFRQRTHTYLIEIQNEIIKLSEKRQHEEAEERKKVLALKQAKQLTSSKVWTEKAQNTDYEKWYKGLCTEEILADNLEDIELEPGSDPLDPKPSQTKGGTLNGLVQMLTYYKYPDPVYTRAFLMTYRSFTTPEELLSLIIERYNVAPPENITNVKQIEYYYVRKIVPIRMRVSNVIRAWLESHFEDFLENNSSLLAQLNEFLEKQMMQIDENLATLIQKTIAKKSERKEQVVIKVQSENAPEIILTENWFGNATKIYHVSPVEIARQLTLLDHKIYSSIQPKEFLNQAWSKEALKDRAPNLRGLIRRSNDLTYFVASDILSNEVLEERQQVLLHWVMVANKCMEINSFNCMVSIYSALSSSPIHRLKKAWEALQAKENIAYLQAWEKLEKITDSSGNRANYRQTLHSINPPCVPFLGMYLTDLVFIDDGNADTLQIGDKSFINFQKRFKTSSIIGEIQQFQQTPYNFKDWSQLIKYLVRTEHLLNDDEMYKQSLKVEPRAKA